MRFVAIAVTCVIVAFSFVSRAGGRVDGADRWRRDAPRKVFSARR